MVPLRFHVLAVDNQNVEIMFRERGVADGAVSRSVDILSCMALLDGQPLELQPYLLKWRNEVSDERTRRFPSQRLPAGIYELGHENTRTFGPGALILDGREMQGATLKMTFTAEVIRPPIVSSVQVVGRGRVWHLAPVRLGGNEMRGTITTLGDHTLELMEGSPTPR